MTGRGLNTATPGDAVIWHDLECGTYDADLPLWLELAALRPGPVLDVGAGTGRVALALARAGHVVHALDHDGELLDALAARAAARGLVVSCVRADACAFVADQRFGVCFAPMQTVHLLADLPAFLRCAFAALRPDGLLAVALLGDGVEPFATELEPDRTERDGVLYESWPTGLRVVDGVVVLERRRERTDETGVMRVVDDVVRLAFLSPAQLARAGIAAGFARHVTRVVAPTEDRAGSVVLVLRRPAG